MRATFDHRIEGALMIRLIDGLPGNVIGFEADGEVGADAYESVLDPAIDAALETYDKVRFLYVLGNEFTGYSGGATWEDTRVGMSHWTKWERIALVTDHSGCRDRANAGRWRIPGGFKTFPVADLDIAEAWVSE